MYNCDLAELARSRLLEKSSHPMSGLIRAGAELLWDGTGTSAHLLSKIGFAKDCGKETEDAIPQQHEGSEPRPIWEVSFGLYATHTEFHTKLLRLS